MEQNPNKRPMISNTLNRPTMPPRPIVPRPAVPEPLPPSRERVVPPPAKPSGVRPNKPEEKSE